MRVSKFIKFLGAAACCVASPLMMSPAPPLYQIIRGEYEDKIRRFSPPEKIFYVFATKNAQGKYSMTTESILKAICFFNYSQPNEQCMKDFNPQNLKRFLGKQNEYQIYDYFNLVRFIAYDREKIKKFFEDKKINIMDKNHFKELMLNHICADYDSFIRESIYIESRQFKPSKEEFLKVVLREAESIYSQKPVMSFEQVISFRRNIMRQLYTYEFRSFKSENKQIDGVDFARSIVKYAQNNMKRKFLKRINAISSNIQNIKVDETQYVNFHFQLQINEKQVESVLSQKGALSRKEIKELMSRGVSGITDGQVEVFFQLLDTDDSGFIEKREILGVISSLGYYWNVKSGQNSLMEVSKMRWASFQDKIKKIQEIILDE